MTINIPVNLATANTLKIVITMSAVLANPAAAMVAVNPMVPKNTRRRGICSPRLYAPWLVQDFHDSAIIHMVFLKEAVDFGARIPK